jgi:uncharacterized phage protein gp47/JayE
MARTAEEISRAIRAQLKLVDPDISAEPLTVERKLIDTVAEQIAQAEIDQYIQQYQFDVDTKVGEDLDRFVALFGFGRLAGIRATGTVTFSRSTVATRDISIPIGTQVVAPATSVTPALAFFTTSNAILYANTTSVEVPIEAAEVGSQGNVAAGSIITLGSASASDISEVTNENATSGGDEEENDAAFRVRFKQTVFRNVAGTRDMYLALAIATKFGRKANVIGPLSRFIEYLQVPATLVVASQIPYAKWTHTFDYYLTDGDPLTETFYNAGSDYTFASNNISPQTTPPTAVAPTLTVSGSGAVPVNGVVLLEHTYTSLNSRNDPQLNVMNKVDVFVSGEDITDAVETLVFPGTGNNFSATSTSPLYTKKWVRDTTGINPVAGNRLQDMLWQPVEALPTSITIGAATFYLGVDYFLVRDASAYKGSRRARSGIEWTSAAAGLITASSIYTISYNFNRLPIVVNELIDSHKQVTSDVLVHAARKRYFNVNVMLMYTAGFASSSVADRMQTALSDFLEKQTFGAVIQVSDLIEVLHEVAGVDNIRLANPSDGVAYGVQEISSDGSTPLGVPYMTDFTLQDSDLPVLNAINITRRSQNTWTG